MRDRDDGYTSQRPVTRPRDHAPLTQFQRDAMDELARTKAENERLKKELENIKELQAEDSKRIKGVRSERKKQGLSGMGDEPFFSEEYWEAHQNMSPEARKVLDEEADAYMETDEYQEAQRELEQARIEEGLGLNTKENK